MTAKEALLELRLFFMVIRFLGKSHTLSATAPDGCHPYSPRRWPRPLTGPALAQEKSRKVELKKIFVQAIGLKRIFESSKSLLPPPPITFQIVRR